MSSQLSYPSLQELNNSYVKLIKMFLNGNYSSSMPYLKSFYYDLSPSDAYALLDKIFKADQGHQRDPQRKGRDEPREEYRDTRDTRQQHSDTRDQHRDRQDNKDSNLRDVNGGRDVREYKTDIDVVGLTKVDAFGGLGSDGQSKQMIKRAATFNVSDTPNYGDFGTKNRDASEDRVKNQYSTSAYRAHPQGTASWASPSDHSVDSTGELPVQPTAESSGERLTRIMSKVHRIFSTNNKKIQKYEQILCVPSGCTGNKNMREYNSNYTNQLDFYGYTGRNTDS